MVNKYNLLFSPFNIGGVAVKNRIVMAPMGTHLQDKDGFVTQELIDYLEERSKGGAGLILVQFSSVVPGQPTLGVYSDKQIEGLARLATAIKKHGCAAFLQISHLGAADPTRPVSASALSSPLFLSRTLPRQLSIEELQALETAFVEAAQRAYQAGFDGVELHGGYSYLVASLYSPHLNRRRDIYGGNFLGRMRFVEHVLKGIKAKIPDFPVGFKLNAHEHVPDGITVDEAIEVAQYLEKMRISYIHVVSSHALDIYCRYPEVPCIYDGQAHIHLSNLSLAIKEAVSVPIIMTGGVNDPDIAERILEEGKADLIAFGRQFIADPAWPRKVMNGEPFRPCIKCNVCHSREVIMGEPVDCTVNPEARRRFVVQRSRLANHKKVIVVGGGPAGIEAALVASRGGLSVTLFEATDDLGGNLRLACVPPFKKDLYRFLEFLLNEIRKSPVELRLSQSATSDCLIREEPDFVIFATGAEPIHPDIPGARTGNTVTAVELLKNPAEYIDNSERFAVLGAGKVGCEVAWYLKLLGKQVILIDTLDYNQLLADEHPFVRASLLTRIRELGIPLLTKRTCAEIKGDKIKVVDEAGGVETLSVDTMVIAVGLEPRRSLITEFSSCNPGVEVICVGDCVEPRDLFPAIHEGFYAGKEVVLKCKERSSSARIKKSVKRGEKERRE